MARLLLGRPAADTSHAILQTFFGDIVSLQNAGIFNPYLDFYGDELRMLSFGLLPNQSRPVFEIVKSHNDVIKLALTLHNHQDSTRSHLRDQLRGNFPGATDQGINEAIDLTLRLWLMLNVRPPALKLQTPKSPVLQWNEGTTLKCFVGQQFPKPSLDVSTKDGRLDPFFTASFMVRICGLKLDWTPFLENHLSLDRRTKTLKVFPYKACLLGYKQESPFPHEMLTETIRTLNLLFPQWDPETDHLLKQHGQTFHDLPPFDGPHTLNLHEFDYWRYQLLELHEDIYRSPPVSWAQLWLDRRNPQQWYTFWIALVILMLTLVSCIASLVQAWASLKALRL